MTQSKLGLKLKPSRASSEDDPGHVIVFWTKANELVCSGFRFDIADLPSDFVDPSNWREYLFENTVRGMIVDEIDFYDECIRDRDAFLIKEWDLPSRAKRSDSQLEDDIRPNRNAGRYSFNPTSKNADNCVTWSVKVIQKHVGQVIERVHEGRIKDMEKQMRGLPFRSSN